MKLHQFLVEDMTMTCIFEILVIWIFEILSFEIPVFHHWLKPQIKPPNQVKLLEILDTHCTMLRSILSI